MGALCHFPPPCHSSLSKLLSNSKSQGVGSRTRRRSSSFSIKASTTAFVPLEHSESTSLGDITRSDFPILRQKVNGRDLVYMDNAATSQKPNYVLKALKEYYEFSNSNVHRGVHYLSQKATTAYENAREKVADFINASDHREIVFTRNATEAINLVANSWGDLNLGSGDEILLTVAEHHSVIVPWQIVAKKKGASLKYVGLTTGEVPDIEKLKKALSNKTKLVVTHHVSNTLGSVHPIEDIVIWSHEVGARVLLDACQSVPHMMVDVQKLNVDFLVASSHKMCGPTGIGFLYGKIDLLSSMPPFLGGGEMISDVFQDYSTYADPPSRFEAGTPAIAEAVGLGAAIEYLYRIGMQRIHDYEVMDAEGVKSLALFPAKFQRNFWIKTGNFVIVDEGGREKALESGDKIACIVSQVLFHAQVRSLEKSPEWPANFKNARPVESQTFQLQPELVLNSDSDEDLPPLEANLNRRRPVDIYSDSASDSDHHS